MTRNLIEIANQESDIEDPEICAVSGCNNNVSKYLERGNCCVPVCLEHINSV